VDEPLDAAANGRAVRGNADARPASLLANGQASGSDFVERPLCCNARNVEMGRQLLLARKEGVNRILAFINLIAENRENLMVQRNREGRINSNRLSTDIQEGGG
jgi:hypothetical protein